MTLPVAFGSLTAAAYTQSYSSKPQKNENSKKAPILNTKKNSLNGYDNITKRIDPSKTKVHKGKGDLKGKTYTYYYDKDGKHLMTMIQEGKSRQFVYTGKDGKDTILNDADGDGNVDRMSIVQRPVWGGEVDVYEDENDDGSFDKKHIDRLS